MQSTFSGIEMAKRSLIAHQTAINTTGHNLSNAGTDGYSRQRVHLAPTDPLYAPALNREETPGQIGQGMDVTRIDRIKDMLLEGRIVQRSNVHGYWEAREKYSLMVEQVYNEPTDVSVRARLDRFWMSWQELSLRPSEPAAREAVVKRGKMLLDGIHTRYQSLKEIRQMLDQDVQAAIEQINSMITEIADLNEEIVKVKALGDNPNDILDRRDLLVKNLSEYIDITIDERDPDEFTVHTGGQIILQGTKTHLFDTQPNPSDEGYSDVVWAQNGEQAVFRGGKLAGLLELRDVDVRSEIQDLDMMTINVIDMVNAIHRDAWGLDKKTGEDFFVERFAINNTLGNYDRDGDGAYDHTYVFRVRGSNTLSPQEQIGLEGTMTLSGAAGQVAVNYNSTDTVEQVISRINTSGSEVVASLDRHGRLVLKATPAEERDNPDFVLRHIEDSGQFLVGYAGILNQAGTDGAFDYNGTDQVLNLRGGELSYAVAPLQHPAAWIEVNPAIKADNRAIAAGFGEVGRPAEPGDGSAALAIAGLRNEPVMIGHRTTFDDYFADAVAKAGLRGEEAEQALKTETIIMKSLQDMKESISGVNIDEELAQLIKYQHGYSATARFISEVNKMLDTLINRVGV